MERANKSAVFELLPTLFALKDLYAEIGPRIFSAQCSLETYHRV
jgi:hypothetical protein